LSLRLVANAHDVTADESVGAFVTHTAIFRAISAPTDVETPVLWVVTVVIHLTGLAERSDIRHANEGDVDAGIREGGTARIVWTI